MGPGGRDGEAIVAKYSKVINTYSNIIEIHIVTLSILLPYVPIDTYLVSPACHLFEAIFLFSPPLAVVAVVP